MVQRRGFKNIRLRSEDIVEFGHRSNKCRRELRVVAVRKNLTIERGGEALFDDVRYHFYITNNWDRSMVEIVREGRQRCNQERLLQQLKTGTRALHAPVNSLNANWAYMVMASLAWSLKAWLALKLPVTPRWASKHRAQSRRLQDFPARGHRRAPKSSNTGGAPSCDSSTSRSNSCMSCASRRSRSPRRRPTLSTRGKSHLRREKPNTCRIHGAHPGAQADRIDHPRADP